MTGPEQLGEHQGLPLLRFADAASWETWLAANHESSHGVWLAIARVGSGATSVTYEQALDIALCHGWIDGRKQGGDAAAWLQKFTPRGPRSAWSQRNREKAEALIAAGRMVPAGLAAVEAARRDGRWEAAYGLSRHRGVPDDLQAALDQNPGAAAFFATLDSRNRYAVLYRVQTAKRAETQRPPGRRFRRHARARRTDLRRLRSAPSVCRVTGMPERLLAPPSRKHI